MSERITSLLYGFGAIICIAVTVWFLVAGSLIYAGTVVLPAEYDAYQPEDKAGEYRSAGIVGMYPVAEEYTSSYSTSLSGNRNALFCVTLLSDGSACIVKIPASGIANRLPTSPNSNIDMGDYESLRISLEDIRLMQPAVNGKTPVRNVVGVTGALPYSLSSSLSDNTAILGASLKKELLASIMLDLTQEVPETVTYTPDISRPSTGFLILCVLLVLPLTLSALKHGYQAHVESDRFIWGKCSEPNMYAPIYKMSRVPAIFTIRHLNQILIEFTDGFRMVVSYYGKNSTEAFTRIHARAVAERKGIALPIEFSLHKEKEKPASNPNGWTCSCGRTHAVYVSSCLCGIRKKDIVLSTANAAATNDTPVP